MHTDDFKRIFLELKRQEALTQSRFRFEWNEVYPCLDEDTKQTSFDPHYVYHTAWASRLLAQNRPSIHHDISSLLYFAVLISAFIPVKFYDYRPANINLPNLTCSHADLLNLPFADCSIDSLSCMHVIEHIGLGRYGDPVKYDGDLLAMKELKRVVSHNGVLLLVVPIGFPRICFNAHRIYGFNQIIECFSGFTLESFSLIPDNGFSGIINNPSVEIVNRQQYGCGCFNFRKN